MQDVIVQTEAFDPGACLNAFTATLEDAAAGAVVSFSGHVRDTEGTLLTLHLDHYPGMTEAALETMRTRAIDRFSLTAARILHRVGPMAPGEPIMFVATAAPHRADAFEGAQYLMDWLKTRAPFWKKEVTRDGETWVAAKPEDDAARDRWGDGA